MYDSQSVPSLFKTYKSKIYNLAFSLSRNEKDAEDILANTFLKIAQNIPRFKGRSNISTWIYRIAYNEAMMLLRKKGRQFRLSARFGNKNGASGSLTVNWAKLPDKLLLDAELKERIESAFKNMPIKYRMPLVMHIINELPINNIAQILNLQVASVKTRLHRAYLLIKSEIESYNKDTDKKVLRQDSRCGIWTKFVYDYALGSLDKKKSTDFKAHIRDCQSCNLFIDTYRQALRITNSLECQDMPQELTAKITTFLSKNN